MRYAPLLLLALLSCKVRIISTPFPSIQTPPIPAGTLIVLGSTSDRPTPDPSFLITNLRCKFPGNFRSWSYDSMLAVVQSTSHGLGGNVAKVRNIESRFAPTIMTVDLYYLPPAALCDYERQLDAAKKAHDSLLLGVAVIHLSDRDEPRTGIALYFNDSLLGEIKRGSAFQKLAQQDFKVNQDGTLKIVADPIWYDRKHPQKYTANISILRDKEYFIILYTTGTKYHTHHYWITDKDHFERPDLPTEPVPYRPQPVVWPVVLTIYIAQVV